MLLPTAKQTLILLLTTSQTTAELLGPLVPAPQDLTSSTSLVAAAWKNLSSTLDAYLKDDVNSSNTASLAGAENVTWSTGLFSVNDPAAAELQYHWTSPEIANAANGTNKVNGDSIYRAASVSKLVTVYAGLLELTQKQWNTPLSELIPGLGKGGNGNGPFSPSQWDEITPWMLANQQSGVTTNGVPS